jgi:hypothetical protein
LEIFTEGNEGKEGGLHSNFHFPLAAQLCKTSESAEPQ